MFLDALLEAVLEVGDLDFFLNPFLILDFSATFGNGVTFGVEEVGVFIFDAEEGGVEHIKGDGNGDGDDFSGDGGDEDSSEPSCSSTDLVGTMFAFTPLLCTSVLPFFLTVDGSEVASALEREAKTLRFFFGPFNFVKKLPIVAWLFRFGDLLFFLDDVSVFSNSTFFAFEEGGGGDGDDDDSGDDNDMQLAELRFLLLDLLRYSFSVRF